MHVLMRYVTLCGNATVHEQIQQEPETAGAGWINVANTASIIVLSQIFLNEDVRPSTRLLNSSKAHTNTYCLLIKLTFATTSP